MAPMSLGKTTSLCDKGQPPHTGVLTRGALSGNKPPPFETVTADEGPSSERAPNGRHYGMARRLQPALGLSYACVSRAHVSTPCVTSCHQPLPLFVHLRLSPFLLLFLFFICHASPYPPTEHIHAGVLVSDQLQPRRPRDDPTLGRIGIARPRRRMNPGDALLSGRSRSVSIPPFAFE